MRDLILLAVLLGISPLIFRAPIVGVVAWIWIALMNPQREVYGLLAGAALNFIVAAVTIFAWIVSKERKTAPANMTLAILGLLVVWMCVTTYFALVPDHSGDLLVRNLKTAALLFTVASIANTKTRVQAIVWVVVLSLAYFGVRGGGAYIASGGHHQVVGPADSLITDNNQIGLALVMTLPLINYLRETTQERIVRTALISILVITIIAILGTSSRGALLALGAMVAFFAFRSRAGAVLLVASAGLAVAAPRFMPAAWLERMSSISSAGKDSSFMDRVSSWRTNFHIATERITGGGFASSENTWVVQHFPTQGGLESGLAAHSIYFQVLGDHGFIGLILFLGLLASALINTASVVKTTRARADLRWANQLARMLQVSIIAYMVGGAALSMAYWDGFLLIIVLTAVLHHTVKRGSAVVEASMTAPKWKRVETEAAALPSPRRPELT